jgi:hypothetical protein
MLKSLKSIWIFKNDKALKGKLSDFDFSTPGALELYMHLARQMCLFPDRGAVGSYLKLHVPARRRWSRRTHNYM